MAIDVRPPLRIDHLAVIIEAVMSDKWNYSVFWEEAINILRARKSEQESEMWLGRIIYHKSEASLIVVLVPSKFFQDQVKTRYLNEIEQLLVELSGTEIKIEFKIQSANKERVSETIEAPVTNSAKSTSKKVSRHPMLNADYTFDHFVIGDNNNFAANAALAIAREPGTIYNPFLIYGGVGLGKTHLLQSIGNMVHLTNPEKKIIYVQMDNFTTEFIESIARKEQHLFKAKYRTADILLIDDIHSITKREGTQEELFYTFNALYDNKKQMVFTCDRPVSEIKEITDRLRNRFERGLNVDLQPPSYETRFAILRKKIESWGVNIPDESIQIICNNITTNVRDLEKAITKLRAFSELMGKEITPEVTREQLKDFFSVTNRKNISIDLIIKEVASYFNLTSQDFRQKRRTQSVSFPRQIAMYISREITEYSTTEIGEEFGGRDHTTIMHGCQKISDIMKSDPTIEPIVKELIRKIKTEGLNS